MSALCSAIVAQPKNTNVRPYCREFSRRENNIRDTEVREIQAVMVRIAPGAIVNLGTVVTGCPCEDGGSCTNQIWAIGYQPGKMSEVLLSEIGGHWTVGPAQKLWWEYLDLKGRQSS